MAGPQVAIELRWKTLCYHKGHESCRAPKSCAAAALRFFSTSPPPSHVLESSCRNLIQELLGAASPQDNGTLSRTQSKARGFLIRFLLEVEDRGGRCSGRLGPLPRTRLVFLDHPRIISRGPDDNMGVRIPRGIKITPSGSKADIEGLF